jgi:hypothetical protein
MREEKQPAHESKKSKKKICNYVRLSQIQNINMKFYIERNQQKMYFHSFLFFFTKKDNS